MRPVKEEYHKNILVQLTLWEKRDFASVYVVLWFKVD